MRPYLVFCSVESLGRCTPELFNPHRQFDVCIHQYGWLDTIATDKEMAQAEYWITGEGEKLNVAASWLRILFEDPRPGHYYRQYAFLDDDLEISVYDLNKLFYVGDELDLGLYQPALTRDSFHSHPHLLQDPKWTDGIIRRGVPFVEIMCPFFSHKVLADAVDTFDINESGWGIDYLIWPKIAPAYVIDAIPIKHGRKPARRDRVLANGLTPYQELWIQQVISDPHNASRIPPGYKRPIT